LVIPLGNIFGPWIVWRARRKSSSFVDDHGKESVNFQVSITLYVILGLMMSVKWLSAVSRHPGTPFVTISCGLTWVFVCAMVVIASSRARKGMYYAYPLTISFLS